MGQILLKHKPVAKRGGLTTAVIKFAPASALEMKALGDVLPDGYIAGWASTPDLDSWGHVVKTGAFDEAITLRGLTGGKGIKLLAGHDWDKPAGAIKVLETRGGRLWIEAQLNLRISYASDLYEASLSAGGLNFSVGFMLQDYEFKDNDGQEYLYITRGDLFEVSVVPFPGNEECTMDFIKTKDDAPVYKTLLELEEQLVIDGLVKSREAAKQITELVKSAPHLFDIAPTSQEEEPADQPPALGDAQVKTIKEKLAGLKKALSKPINEEN